MESTPRRSSLLFQDLGAGKSLVNLKEVVCCQAMDLGIGLDQIHSEKIDTRPIANSTLSAEKKAVSKEILALFV